MDQKCKMFKQMFKYIGIMLIVLFINQMYGTEINHSIVLAVILTTLLLVTDYYIPSYVIYEPSSV